MSSSTKFQTAYLFLTWIVLSIHIELIAPTMKILAKNVQVDYSGMATVLASRAFGFLIANVLGVLFQFIVRKYSYGILVFAFFLSGIVILTTPFMSSVIYLCILFFIQGISHGLTELSGTHLILSMWNEKSSVPLNIVHFGYGIGAILINLIVRPFLIGNIVFPYAITGVLCILVSFGHLVLFVRSLKSQKLIIFEESKLPIDSLDENIRYKLILSTIFVCSIFFISGNDQTFSKFFFTFLKLDEFHLSTGIASWGIIFYWSSYSIGRLIFAIVSAFVSVQMCLNIVWFGALCIAIVWSIFMWIIGLNGLSLLVLGMLTGLVISPISPLTFALFNQRLNVVPMLISSVFCGSAIGTITFEKIAGFVLDQDPNHFPTVLVICIIVSIFFYISGSLVYFFRREK